MENWNVSCSAETNHSPVKSNGRDLFPFISWHRRQPQDCAILSWTPKPITDKLVSLDVVGNTANSKDALATKLLLLKWKAKFLNLWYTPWCLCVLEMSQTLRFESGIWTSLNSGLTCYWALGSACWEARLMPFGNFRSGSSFWFYVLSTLQVVQFQDFTSGLSILSFITSYVRLFEVSKMINVHATLWKLSLVFLQIVVLYMWIRSKEEILSFACTAASTTTHLNIAQTTAKVTQLCLKLCLWSSASFY